MTEASKCTLEGMAFIATVIGIFLAIILFCGLNSDFECSCCHEHVNGFHHIELKSGGMELTLCDECSDKAKEKIVEMVLNKSL